MSNHYAFNAQQPNAQQPQVQSQIESLSPQLFDEMLSEQCSLVQGGYFGLQRYPGTPASPSMEAMAQRPVSRWSRQSTLGSSAGLSTALNGEAIAPLPDPSAAGSTSFRDMANRLDDALLG